MKNNTKLVRYLKSHARVFFVVAAGPLETLTIQNKIVDIG